MFPSRSADCCREYSLSDCSKGLEILWFPWCCRGGLNSRPLPYQGDALPLMRLENLPFPRLFHGDARLARDLE